ncbi:hypothetical protein EX30DRAFT_341258 [Ascodesmis nigricans]|uniref:Uncharacterized protein n=1 Tax=Ascodesmis nigricans TaxID=341454 RepID=A0A4S2MWK4_9PEZI|nr:hypothetical protein EX30DRAFT_341258 [Ascodesmis nigricans]
MKFSLLAVAAFVAGVAAQSASLARMFPIVIFKSAIDVDMLSSASPTNSVGCEPHGDHWHCTGYVSSSLPAPFSSRILLTTFLQPQENRHCDHSRQRRPLRPRS